MFLPIVNVHTFQSTEPNDKEVMVRVILRSGYCQISKIVACVCLVCTQIS